VARTYDPLNPDHSPLLRDWVVYTDGSGHKDGYGGCAAVGWNKGVTQTFQLMQGRNETSTARMEMEALLMSLQWIAEHRELNERPCVWWLSDRQDLVMSVAKICERRKNPDLWYRLSYYESMFDIHPYHAPRATTKGNVLVDSLAGAGRKLIKNYLENDENKSE